MENKKFIYISIILLFISMALNFPFPHENPYGVELVSIFNRSVTTVNGIDYVATISLLLLITSLFLLVKSLKKYHVRFVLIAIVIAVLPPPFVANSFQKTIATGIYAISYQSDESICSFQMKNETVMHGECELIFENYRSKSTQFSIEFYEDYPFEDDIRMISLMNNGSPYEVSLSGKERKRVIIETDIDVSQMENQYLSGEANVVNIIIKSGDKTRKL